MTGTERKRAWRLAHPEQSREAERLRAQARRDGYWGTPELGGPALRPCESSDSYQQYETSRPRLNQRFLYPIVGPGSRTMTKAERKAAINSRGAARMAPLLAALGSMPRFTAEEVREYLASKAGRA